MTNNISKITKRAYLSVTTKSPLTPNGIGVHLSFVFIKKWQKCSKAKGGIKSPLTLKIGVRTPNTIFKN